MRFSIKRDGFGKASSLRVRLLEVFLQLLFRDVLPAVPPQVALQDPEVVLLAGRLLPVVPLPVKELTKIDRKWSKLGGNQVQTWLNAMANTAEQGTRSFRWCSGGSARPPPRCLRRRLNSEASHAFIGDRTLGSTVMVYVYYKHMQYVNV